jgi:hypothetical protein
MSASTPKIGRMRHDARRQNDLDQTSAAPSVLARRAMSVTSGVSARSLKKYGHSFALRVCGWTWASSAVLGMACTLTQEEFEPTRVEVASASPRVPDAGTGVDAGLGTRACLGPGVCCVDDGECEPGQVCLDGSCAVRSCVGAEDVASCLLTLCPGPSCPMPAEPTCADGVQNGSEAGIDCGGACAERCASSSTCSDALDCASHNCTIDGCAAASCEDGILNQDESAIDCGGSCAGCPTGAPCSAVSDCVSRVCSADGACVTASCADGIRNQDETDVDCGASCGTCADGAACQEGGDCTSGVCDATGCDPSVGSCCQVPSCADGVANASAPPPGAESDVDCGGTNPECARCADGGRCNRNGDCLSNVCDAGVCAAAGCDDGVRNGAETSTDCGGSGGCTRCRDGQRCGVDGDCASNDCSNGICVSCGDALLNGGETDVDCGGGNPTCERCSPGQSCRLDRDCGSGACQDGRCCGGNQADCTRCAERLSATLDCDAPADGIDATGIANCSGFLQCLSDNSAECPTRSTLGCSGNDPATVCYDNLFGGTDGTAMTRAVAVLGNAGCQL